MREVRTVIQVPIAEGQLLGLELLSREIPARLSGGVGIALRCPSITRIAPNREYHDIDMCVSARALGRLDVLLSEMGYEPAKRFNALNAGRQMMFDSAQRQVHLDVFVDRLRMCHVLDFREQLTGTGVSLPATDLLLSKLQIVQLTEKDLLDIVALLIDSSPAKGPTGPEDIELDRISK
jgi:hypothetical protein